VGVGPYQQSLILHNNAGPLGAAASLHAALATPNVTLLEAPWVNGSGETDVAGGAPVWPYPKIVDGYALPLEGPGLGIEFDEELAASKPFVPSLQPRLNGLDGSVRDF
jgi:galactonate dehydratase